MKASSIYPNFWFPIPRRTSRPPCRRRRILGTLEMLESRINLSPALIIDLQTQSIGAQTSKGEPNELGINAEVAAGVEVPASTTGPALTSGVTVETTVGNESTLAAASQVETGGANVATESQLVASVTTGRSNQDDQEAPTTSASGSAAMETGTGSVSAGGTVFFTSEHGDDSGHENPVTPRPPVGGNEGTDALTSDSLTEDSVSTSDRNGSMRTASVVSPDSTFLRSAEATANSGSDNDRKQPVGNSSIDNERPSGTGVTPTTADVLFARFHRELLDATGLATAIRYVRMAAGQNTGEQTNSETDDPLSDDISYSRFAALFGLLGFAGSRLLQRSSEERLRRSARV